MKFNHAPEIGCCEEHERLLMAVPSLLEAIKLLRDAIQKDRLLDIRKHFSLCVADSMASAAIARVGGENEG